MKIFIDMDGVIADMVGYIDYFFSRKVSLHSEVDWWTYYGNILYNVPWSDQFWADIPKTPEADELMALAADFGDVCVHTSFMRKKGCVEGKIAWMQRWFPDVPFLVGSSGVKHFLSHTNSVLVDDKTSNVTEFHAEGGHAFLWPTPWNQMDTNVDRVELFNLFMRGIR